MVRTKLAGGRIERGHAVQRHFARVVDQADGMTVVCSHGSNEVSISVDSETPIGDVIEIIEEHDGEPSFNELASGSVMYQSGSISIDVSL